MRAPIASVSWLKAAALLLALAQVRAPTSAAKKQLKEQEIIQRVLRDYDWRVSSFRN